MPQQIDVPGMGVVEFPDGMSDDDIVKAIQANKPSAAADVAKSAGIGLAQGAIALPGLPGDLERLLPKAGDFLREKAVQYGLMTPEQAEADKAKMVAQGFRDYGEFKLPSSADIQRKVEGVTGKFYEPQTRYGQYAQSGGQFVGNPLSYVGGGTLPVKAATALASGLGSEAAGQATEGTQYEPYARLAGAIIAGGATGAALPGEVAVPTRQALKDVAGEGYKAAREIGGEVSGPAVGNLGDTIMRGLEQDGINAKLAPKTFSILDEVANPPAGSTATISNFETIRRTLKNAAQDFSNGTERLAASQAINKLDDYLAAIPRADIASEPFAGALEQAGNIRDEARANYAAAKRAELLDDKLRAAEIQAAKANSGQNFTNTARQRIADVLMRPKLAQGYNADELAQMEQVVRGTTTGNALRRVGNLLGGGGGLGQLLAAGAGGALGEYIDGHQGGAAGAVALPILGILARRGAAASTSRQIQILDQLVRSRSPLAEQMAANAPVSANARAAMIRALLANTTNP